MKIGALGGRSPIPHGPNPSIFNVRRPNPAAADYAGWTDFSAVGPIAQQGSTTFGMTWEYAIYRHSVISAHSRFELPSWLDLAGSGFTDASLGQAGQPITLDLAPMLTDLNLATFGPAIGNGWIFDSKTAWVTNEGDGDTLLTYRVLDNASLGATYTVPSSVTSLIFVVSILVQPT